VYPNNGFVLAGALCEKVTGKTYEALMFEEVFKPLGIATAGFGAPPMGNPQGHRKAMIGSGVAAIGVDVGADNPPPMSPAGRAHMSLPDLAKFALAHSEGHNGLRNEYLSQKMWQKLHTPPVKTANGNDYAYGWIARKDGTLWHNGSNTSWLAECAFDPSKNIAACACANLFDAGEAVSHMLALGLAKAAG
jgi:CubicO group peptidase (beta-lactamase class C family)